MRLIAFNKPRFHAHHLMRLLQLLSDPVHDAFAHFVILSELIFDTGIKSILEIGNLVLVQVGDGGLFLQGHVGQDFLDDLVYVGRGGHNFFRRPEIF